MSFMGIFSYKLYIEKTAIAFIQFKIRLSCFVIHYIHCLSFTLFTCLLLELTLSFLFVRTNHTKIFYCYKITKKNSLQQRITLDLPLAFYLRLNHLEFLPYHLVLNLPANKQTMHKVFLKN